MCEKLFQSISRENRKYIKKRTAPQQSAESVTERKGVHTKVESVVHHHHIESIPYPQEVDPSPGYAL